MMTRKLVCGAVLNANSEKEMTRKVTSHAIYSHLGTVLVPCSGLTFRGETRRPAGQVDARVVTFWGREYIVS